MNMVGSSGPTGTTGWTADANQPGGYTQTTTLSPSQQHIYDQGTQAQAGALGVANQQIGRVGEALGHGLDPSGVQTSFDHGGPLQYGFNPGQQVQGQVGSADFNGAAHDAANAVYGQAASRLDPQWQQAQSAEESKLANQGLGANSTAYQNEMANFNRSKTDAYNQANYSSIGAGLQAQQQQFGQQLNQGQFANAAAGQQYGQNQGQAAFNNTTAGQQFGQNQAAATFGNQANAQQFAQNAQAQELPINEFNSLMSSSQVASPQAQQYTPSQVGNTDVLGAYALNSSAAQAAYKSQMENQASGMGGLFNLGAAGIKTFGPMLMTSDYRLKRDMTLLAREDDGLGVWRYRYIWDHDDEPLRIGVMAQEAQALRPHAVHTDPSGYLAVNYAAL